MRTSHSSSAWACALALAFALAQPAWATNDTRADLPADVAPAGATSVQIWHAAARDAVARHKPNQQAALRLLAYLSLAQHRGAEAFADLRPDASDDAWPVLFDTVSLATLSALLPADAAAFQALAQGLAATRASAPANEDLARARAVGERVARDTVGRAARDGFDLEWTGTLPQESAAWRSLIQPARPPHLPALGSMKTLFLASGDALRPGAPPPVGSVRFNEALAEVRNRVGSGSPAGKARALRWEMTGGALVAGFWDETAVNLAARHGQSGRAMSRTLAVTLGAAMDANIACHDAKYTYWTPRPSQADPSIRPLIGVPNHPSYPSNHSCDSEAAATVLGSVFPAYRQSLAAMANEASESRIDAGLHYRFDIEAGTAIGRAAAAAALRGVAMQLSQGDRP